MPKGSKKGKNKRKATAGNAETSSVSTKKEHLEGAKKEVEVEDVSNLQFEDDFEDEIEEDEVAQAAEGEDEEMMVDEEPTGVSIGEGKKEKKKEKKEKKTVSFDPSILDTIGTDEKLDYDPTAYTTLHKVTLPWPCLTFDILPDKLGIAREKFPLTFFIVAGTQAAEEKKNHVSILKVSDIHKTQHEEDDDDDDPDVLDDDPILEEKNFPHLGGINRIRAMPQHPHIVATWSEKAVVSIWNTEKLLNSLIVPPRELVPRTLEPVHTFTGHTNEGFAMDWSPQVPGNLLTGDCNSLIYLWTAQQNGWTVGETAYRGHTQSVEDLQWSPNEKTVFASCSVDKTIRIWDTRVREKCQLFVAAHKADVNVIAWSKRVSHLLASGGDDCHVKVWDLRNFKSAAPSADYKFHKGPITSVDWHPTDESVLAASSEDDSLSVWDMSLEVDTDGDKEEAKKGPAGENIPDQLLFLHQGQKKIKEIHFHPQIPSLIISTASDGFDIFKASNM